MISLYDSMIRFFEEDGWYHKPFKNIHAIRLPFKGATADWACIAQVQEENRLFVFYSVCPVKTTPENRLAVSEFIMLANYGMLIGNFEMDMSDGEIRFKTSVGLGQLDWSDELAKVAVYTNVFSMNQYLSGLLKVMGGDILPRNAVDIAEIGNDESDS
ncbi:YbjN domain-containing protein [Pseudanabaena sp. SR411]|uniref:YbjN domain-containing protein n=1 Tax=Pseudanabaena sp. SR411 TaxID=1980935 RepID=UPI0011404C16|nr:YbjN domain-containing protein [Pseudanabaena sp. SR411]